MTQNEFSYLGNVEKLYGSKMTTDLHRVIFKTLSRKYFPDSKVRIIDVGIGLGHCSIALLELGYTQITGVDIDEHYFTKLREAEISTHRANVETEELPFENESFDVAISFHLVEHLRDPSLFMKELHRVLSNKGLLLLATPNWRRDWKRFYDDETHVHPYTKRGIKRLCEKFGFETQAVKNLEVFRWGLYYTRLWKLFPFLAFTGRRMLYIGRK